MFMIVFHHFVAKNGFNIDTQIIGITPNKLFLQIMGNNAFIGNNLFFMVSAWFLIDNNKQFNLKKIAIKIWKLERQILFYSITLFIVCFTRGQIGGDMD